MDPNNNSAPTPNPALTSGVPPTEPVSSPASTPTPVAAPESVVASAPTLIPTSVPKATPASAQTSMPASASVPGSPVSTTPIASVGAQGDLASSDISQTSTGIPESVIPMVPQQPTASEPVVPINPVPTNEKAASQVVDPPSTMPNSAPVDQTPQFNSNNTMAMDGLAMQPGPVSGNSLESSMENPFADKIAGSTPNVSFTDPVEQTGSNSISSDTAPNKKKSSKTTLIILTVLAFMVVIALAAVLIFQLVSGEQKKPEIPAPAPDVVENGGDEQGDNSDGNNNSNNVSNTYDVGDKIICTANQDTIDKISSQSGQNIKDNTLTLNFSNNKLVGIVMDLTIVDENGAEMSTTSEYTVSQFFEQAGLSEDELAEQGVKIDEDGNAIVNKDQLLSVGINGYTCISPNQS